MNEFNKFTDEEHKITKKKIPAIYLQAKMLLHYPGQHLQRKSVMQTIPQNSYVDKTWNSTFCYMIYSIMRKVWETKITHRDSLKLLAFKLQTL